MIADNLLTIIGLDAVTTVSQSAVVTALDAYARSGDFGDLRHAALTAEAGATSIVTFDRDFATPISDLQVETLHSFRP